MMVALTTSMGRGGGCTFPAVNAPMMSRSGKSKTTCRMTDPVRIVVGILSTFFIFLIGIALMSELLPEVADGPFASVAYSIVGVFEILPKLMVGGTIAAVAFILAVLSGRGGGGGRR